MGKSLTDVAKQVLMSEGQVPSVSSSDNNPDRDAKASNPNRATLKPKSKWSEPNPMHDESEDLGGATPTSPYSTNLGQKASGKKDSSKSSKSSVAAQPPQKLSEEEEELEAIIAEMLESGMTEEEVEEVLAEALNEDEETIEEESELDKLITAMVEEGYSTEEIEKALSEAMTEESDELELSEENVDAIIDAMIEEGYSDEEIEKALSEAWDEDRWNKQVANGKAAEAANKSAKPFSDNQSLGALKKVGKAVKKVVTKEDIDMSEHVAALLEGEDLSEDFKDKATTIFESAINTKLAEEVDMLEEAYAKSLEEEVAKVYETLSEQVDDYLNYVVENWVAENEIAMEPALRTELTEEFIAGLRNLFAEHYIDVPDEQVPVLEELGARVEELESKLNEEIETNISLTKQLSEAVKHEIFTDVCEDLTDSQAAKLAALAENIEFTNPEEFAYKVETLKESYFPISSPRSEPLDRAESTSTNGRGMIAENLEGPMAAYVNTIGKTLPQ